MQLNQLVSVRFEWQHISNLGMIIEMIAVRMLLFSKSVLNIIFISINVYPK